MSKTMANPPHIDIVIKDSRWPDLECLAQKLCTLTLCEAAYEPTYKASPLELCLVLADNDFIQDLNKNYRAKDKPTNVLSFPQMDTDTPFISAPNEPQNLGDIIMAYETISQEAKEQEKSFEDHAAHLIVHGLLHLIGYDHQDDEEAEEMEALETKILNHLDIKSPY